MLALVHILVNLGDVLEATDFTDARIELAAAHQVIIGGSLRIVGAVRPLQALLPRPQVAQIDHSGETACASADHDHAALLTDENRGGNGILTGMFEDDGRAAALAQDIPDFLAEGASTFRPLLLSFDIRPVRRNAPVVELRAVDVADRT